MTLIGRSGEETDEVLAFDQHIAGRLAATPAAVAAGAGAPKRQMRWRRSPRWWSRPRNARKTFKKCRSPSR